MTKKQQEIIDGLINGISAHEKSIYSNIIYYLAELGYIPQKNRSFLSFKHKVNGKIIAK